MIGVVTSTFFGALFTDIGADPGEFRTVARITGYKPGVKRREINDIPTEPDTPRHLLASVYTLIGTPLTDLGRLLAPFDALTLLVTQAVDLRNGLCKSHCSSFNESDWIHHCACLCVGMTRNQCRRWSSKQSMLLLGRWRMSRPDALLSRQSNSQHDTKQTVVG